MSLICLTLRGLLALAAETRANEEGHQVHLDCGIYLVVDGNTIKAVGCHVDEDGDIVLVAE